MPYREDSHDELNRLVIKSANFSLTHSDRGEIIIRPVVRILFFLPLNGGRVIIYLKPSSATPPTNGTESGIYRVLFIMMPMTTWRNSIKAGNRYRHTQNWVVYMKNVKEVSCGINVIIIIKHTEEWQESGRSKSGSG